LGPWSTKGKKISFLRAARAGSGKGWGGNKGMPRKKFGINRGKNQSKRGGGTCWAVGMELDKKSGGQQGNWFTSGDQGGRTRLPDESSQQKQFTRH